mgnify:CR=1 FL=1
MLSFFNILYIILFLISFFFICKKKFNKRQNKKIIQDEKKSIQDNTDTQTDEKDSKKESNESQQNLTEEYVKVYSISDEESISTSTSKSHSESNNSQLHDSYNLDLNQINDFIFQYNKLKKKYKKLKYYSKSYVHETTLKINYLNNKNKDLKNENKNLINELSNYEKHLNIYINDNDSLKQKNIDLESNLWSLNKENDKNINLIKILNEEINQRKIEIIKLRKK